MSLKSLVCNFVLTIVFLLNSGYVGATTVVIPDTSHLPMSFTNQASYNLGDLNPGDSGNITFISSSDSISRTEYAYLFANIPNNTKLTFSFNSYGYSPDTNAIVIEGITPNVYDPTVGPFVNVYDRHFLSSLQGEIRTTIDNSKLDGVPTTSLAFAAAQLISDGPIKGSAYIENVSNDQLKIKGIVQQVVFGGPGSTIQINYEVSAVPIPAALPMFGLGLAGLIGVRSRKSMRSRGRQARCRSDPG